MNPIDKIRNRLKIIFLIIVFRYLSTKNPIDNHDNFLILPEDYGEHNGEYRN